MARPKKHTKDQIEAIIERFANGEKLIKLFKNYNITRTTFNNRMREFEILDLYMRARELHGDGFNDEIEALKDDLKNKNIDPATARVLMDTIKWQASKFYPKMYGDKLDLSTNGESLNKTVDLSKFSYEELEKLTKGTNPKGTMEGEG